MKKALSDFLEDTKEFSSKASDVSRQLAFAGIAVVWIYKNPDSSPTIVKPELVLPLLLWVISLGLDLIQYFFASLSWYIFFHIKQYLFNNNKLKKTDDITAPYWLDFVITGFFIVKIAVNIWAYIELILFFIPKL